ncbi:MAG: MMPL family transporter [Acidimicrobiales bacterium]
MFRRIGLLSVRRRRLILALTGLFFVIAAVVGGGGVFGKLKGGGFDDPSAESTRARDYLDERLGVGDPNLVLVVTASGGSDSAAAAADGAALTQRLVGVRDVTNVVSYWSLGGPPALRSDDGGRVLVLARIVGEDDDAIADRFAEVRDEIGDTAGSLTIEYGGQLAVFDEISHVIERDLATAESIAVPITLILLVFVFGSVVAASLPLFVGAIAVVGAFLTLYVLGSITDVSIFSINLTTAMGLGLAIDYSLFVVSRFREELHKGLDVEAAVVRTVESAGRTVAFSALTVAVSLMALLVFPLYFLRSFAYAGVAVVLVAMIASIVSLPALLATLGTKVDAWKLIRRPAPHEGSGFWHRIAMWVMRRPISVGTGAAVLLIVLGLPFLGVNFGLADDRALPTSNQARQTADVLRTEFTSNEADAFGIAVPELIDDSALTNYATAISKLEGVERVDTRLGSFAAGANVAPANPSSAQFDGGDAGTYLSVVPNLEPVSDEGESLIHAIRDLDTGFSTLVGGSSAALVDTKAAIVDKLPLAGGLIAVATFVLLFLMFGSLLVPAKALVLNLLSLTATFGAMVWVFQDGHLSGFLNFTATGILDTTTPILMFCIAFGLSMDYEVFLLARIKEEHDRTGDNTHSVAMGLERTGRIVTAAAALLAVTFIAFGTSQVSFIKLFGLGLALAVVMDATIVRGTLVPAFMRLAGEANWWAPAPLRRFHRRFGLHEHVELSDISPVVEAPLTGAPAASR